MNSKLSQISGDQTHIKIKINDHLRKKDRNMLLFHEQSVTIVHFYYLSPLVVPQGGEEKVGAMESLPRHRRSDRPIRYHRLANRPVTR